MKFLTTSALLFLLLVTPVLAYDSDEYDDEYRPDNFEEAVDYSEYKDCKSDLDDFIEEYEEIDDQIEDTFDERYKNSQGDIANDDYRSFTRKELKKDLLVLKEEYEYEFDSCVERAERNNVEPLSEKEEEDRDDDIESLEDQIRDKDKQIAALETQVAQLLEMVRGLLALGLKL